MKKQIVAERKEFGPIPIPKIGRLKSCNAGQSALDYTHSMCTRFS
jgi:hypothetical protein